MPTDGSEPDQSFCYNSRSQCLSRRGAFVAIQANARAAAAPRSAPRKSLLATLYRRARSALAWMGRVGRRDLEDTTTASTLGAPHAHDARQTTQRRRARCPCTNCRHATTLDVDSYPDDMLVLPFGPHMVCRCCGIIGADARPISQSEVAMIRLTTFSHRSTLSLSLDMIAGSMR
jgi:hypothetical protein